MKHYFTWLQILGKRLLRKPLFLFTLFLIPATVLLLRGSIHPKDSAIHVLLYSEESAGKQTQDTIHDLLAQSNTIVTFSRCNGKEELYKQILSGKADCGYLFPENLDQALQDHATQKKAVISVVYAKNSLTSPLIQELVYSKVYPKLCYYILENHVKKRVPSSDEKELNKLYQEHQTGKSFFSFEYTDGSKNELLNQEDTNYMLLPMRGIAAIFLFLAALTGMLYWYEDKEHQLLCWLAKSKRNVIRFFYAFQPTFLAGIVGLLSLLLSGISSNLGNEVLCMFLFILAATSFSLLLSLLLPKIKLFLAVIPLLVGGSMILCPVFLNLTTSNPICSLLSKLLPVTYYLESIHSNSGKWHLCLYTVILLLCYTILANCVTVQPGTFIKCQNIQHD